jgi:hypothetical protein
VKTYKIIIQPYGVRYLISTVRQDLYQWLREHNIDIKEYMESYKELDIPKYMKPDFDEDDEYSSWSEDFGCEEYTGISLSNSCRIEVFDNNDIIWSSPLDKKSLKRYGVQVDETVNSLNSPVGGTIFFVGEYNSKDYMEYELKTNDVFNPKLLTLATDNINDEIFITNVEYKKGDVDWSDGGGEDKGWSFFFHISKGPNAKSPHPYDGSQCTEWFNIKTLPTKNGFYEVKKCDEEVSSILLKWKKNSFYRQQEDHKYDKNWNIKSTKIIDVEVPFTDISCWRGLKKEIK